MAFYSSIGIVAKTPSAGPLQPPLGIVEIEDVSIIVYACRRARGGKGEVRANQGFVAEGTGVSN